MPHADSIITTSIFQPKYNVDRGGDGSATSDDPDQVLERE